MGLRVVEEFFRNLQQGGEVHNARVQATLTREHAERIALSEFEAEVMRVKKAFDYFGPKAGYGKPESRRES